MKNLNILKANSSRTTKQGTRVYEVVGTKLPSVTTILGATKDQEFLKKWKAKVGEAKAEEIKNLSSRRGTAMHKYLECYIESKGYEDLTDIGVQAKPMAQKIIDIGLAPVDEWYGSEVTLYYPGLYAGSTDLVCRHNGMDTIIDFKQANRPKNKDWIDDYYLQIAAYCMAHDYVYDSQIQQGIIMVCTPDLYFQEFKFQDHELRQWKHKFLKRLDMYHELMHSEKQTKEPMKEEEFKK
jgi:ATP-dependent exoDNAse (exonuclease V) beta subunit